MKFHEVSYGTRATYVNPVKFSSEDECSTAFLNRCSMQYAQASIDDELARHDKYFINKQERNTPANEQMPSK